MCHLLGMSSACLNPILYGFLNKTFRREFKNIFNIFVECVRAVAGLCNVVCKKTESAENTISFDVLTTAVSQTENRQRQIINSSTNV